MRRSKGGIPSQAATSSYRLTFAIKKCSAMQDDLNPAWRFVFPVIEKKWVFHLIPAGPFKKV
jgi:hypothetical protein